MDTNVQFLITDSIICVSVILLGLIPAIIAKNNGHSFLAWWLFGSVLFIIALPLAVILKPPREEREYLQIESGKMKRCPYCAELIKAGAITCRYCRKDISEALPDIIQCPLCGKGIDLEGKERIEKKFICAECGKLVDMTQADISAL